mgnify:CR=1 FL=1
MPLVWQAKRDAFVILEGNDMLTTEPTPEMAAEWKRIFEKHRDTLTPNRKSGQEVARYFRKNYAYQRFEKAEPLKAALLDFTQDDGDKKMRAAGARLNIFCYGVGNILIAIDACTGSFHVECENIEKAVPIYDDLFVYRGLDAEGIKIFF